MITAILDLSILLAEAINAGEGLRDRSGGYIGETQKVENSNALGVNGRAPPRKLKGLFV